jgi:hypothetical protein
VGELVELLGGVWSWDGLRTGCVSAAVWGVGMSALLQLILRYLLAVVPCVLHSGSLLLWLPCAAAACECFVACAGSACAVMTVHTLMLQKPYKSK